MDYTIFIMIGVIVLLVILTVVGLMSCYKKCPSDKLLVVYGWIRGKSNACKVYPGGGVFVVPGLQSCKTMDMLPYQIKSHIKGPDKGLVITHVDVALTTAISTDSVIQINAANRFLTAEGSAIEEQIKTILDGTIRDVVATMPIEELNNNREEFIKQISQTLKPKLSQIGFDIIDINIQSIQDEDEYLSNLGKKKVTEAKANALADIAEKEKVGAVRRAQIKKDQSIQVATADQEEQTSVNEQHKMRDVQVAEIAKDREVRLATAEKERESQVAEQNAEKAANIARANANADIKQAEAEADAAIKVAQANANADAAESEAEANREIRIAKAAQNQEAETIKATQDKQAREAEYVSLKEQRKAEADKKAGVAQQEAKIAVAEATAKAGKAQAEQVKTVETAKVDAEMTVAQTRQERQLMVNEAEAKATEAKLHATEIVPAQKAKERVVIDADAEKQKIIIAAEAQAEAIRKQAEADADKIRMTKTAEAEGVKAVKLAEAEGLRASLMADADAKTKVGMIPAEVIRSMIDAGMSPEGIVQYMTVDHIEGIAAAQAQAFEHIHLGQVNVYGNENTAANFMTSVAEAAMPLIKTAEPVKNAIAGLFKGSSKKITEGESSK